MGDLVRDAFQASGIDEEMEKVIADAILQRWNDEQLRDATMEKSNLNAANPRTDLVSPPMTPKQHTHPPGLDCAKVRLLSEQLWRRLERKYEAKLEAWKKSEEKQLDAMLQKLRIEYKDSVDAKHAQYNEMTRRKEEELRKMGERLREENRLEFEKRHREMQREWGVIEAERRDIRLCKDQFESAKANFAIKIENEEMRLRREKDAVERLRDEVTEKERKLQELIRSAINETERRERNWIAEQINEWNAREAKLNEKCQRLCERVNQSGIDQNTIREQSSTISILQADLESCRQKLAHSEGKLRELENQLRRFHDYDDIREENVKLRFELDNGITAERLKAKEIEVANLERRLKLVEEAASLRIRELKLQLKLTTEKLERKLAECRKYRSSMATADQIVVTEPSRSAQNKLRAVSLSESLSSTSANSSSSFDRNLRYRLKNIDQLSHQLDISLEKYRSGNRHRDKAIHRSFRNAAQINSQTVDLHMDSEVEVDIRKDGVPTAEVVPQAKLSTFVTPLITSTPLSTVDEKVTKMNIDKLTPLQEASGETAQESSLLTPIALPTDKANPNGESSSVERREELAEVPKENSFEERLKDRAQRLRGASIDNNQSVVHVEKPNEEPTQEVDPIMQQYMNIVLERRKKGNESNKNDKDESVHSKVNATIGEDTTEDLHVDHGGTNSGSEFDW